MKKLIVITALALITLTHEDACAKKWEFQIADEVPDITIKVETVNKKNDAKRVDGGSNRSITIDIIGGDEIAVLSINKQCGSDCDAMDEIYVADDKPLKELLSVSGKRKREKNPSEQGPYVENIRRYYQPNLKGKTKFRISKGWGAVGFFQVDPLP